MARFQPSPYSFARPNPKEEPSTGAKAAAFGLLLLGPLVVTPWVVKAFKPEWSYGRRVGVGLGISMALGAVKAVTSKGD